MISNLYLEDFISVFLSIYLIFIILYVTFAYKAWDIVDFSTFDKKFFLYHKIVKNMV